MEKTYVMITHGQYKGFKGIFIGDNKDGTCGIHVFTVGELDYKKRKFVFVD